MSLVSDYDRVMVFKKNVQGKHGTTAGARRGRTELEREKGVLGRNPTEKDQVTKVELLGERGATVIELARYKQELLNPSYTRSSALVECKMIESEIPSLTTNLSSTAKVQTLFSNRG